VPPRINGPRPAWLNRKESADWLGLGTTEFERECESFPHLLPCTRMGREDKWAADDLAVYHYLRSHGRTGAPAPGTTPDDPDGAPREKK
jgi:hypothetical protein